MSLPSNSNSLSILNVEFQRQLLIQRSTRSMRALQPGPLFTPSTGRVPHQLCHLRKIQLRPLQRAPKPLNAASSSPASPPAHGAQGQKDPFAERTVYNDNYFDRLFIKIYTKKIAAQLNDVYVPEEPTYDDFVRVSKEIMKGRTPEQQKTLVLDVLKTLLPDFATRQFRNLFPPTQTSAELNALFATLGFGWLVGDMERKQGDIKVGPNEVRQQNSIVKIKKCRYLEASGCVGMCTNVCKMPTQTFFTDEFGLPLTMKPNFEDLSCEMIFGQPPEPRETDEAFKQPCFTSVCNIAKERQLTKEGAPCPKLNSR